MRLISTDFDGTLVGFEPDQRCPEAFLVWLATMRRRREDVVWMLNTGRWIDSVRERMIHLRVGLWPDFVGAGERELYRRVGQHFEPMGDWNEVCTRAHERLREDCDAAFEEIVRFLERETAAALLDERGTFAGALASSREEADVIQSFLGEVFARHPTMSVARNGEYFRFCHRDYHKGACIAELQRELAIAPEETFACGDHFNDLPMLDVRFARRLACPANAIIEVKEAVRRGDGVISERPFTEGLVDGLEQWMRRMAGA